MAGEPGGSPFGPGSLGVQPSKPGAGGGICSVQTLLMPSWALVNHAKFENVALGSVLVA